MINNLLQFLLMLSIILAIMFLMYLIWWMFWNIILLPIRKKDAIIKERDDAKIELQQIQAQKAIEWDKYKELVDELDKLRKSYFSQKETNDKLKEENAKLGVDKENLKASIQVMKKQSKENDKKE